MTVKCQGVPLDPAEQLFGKNEVFTLNGWQPVELDGYAPATILFQRERVSAKGLALASEANESPAKPLGPVAIFGHDVGVFRFRYVARGNVRLIINSLDDMRKAMERLPGVFGERLRVNVEWDEKKNCLVRKK